MAYLPLAFATTIWCSSCGLKRVGDVGDTGDENLITGGISTPRAPPLDAHPQPREWTSSRAQLSNFLGQWHAVYDLVLQTKRITRGGAMGGASSNLW